MANCMFAAAAMVSLVVGLIDTDELVSVDLQPAIMPDRSEFANTRNISLI